MNKIEQDVFLEFIKQQYYKYDSLYLEKEANTIKGFWFYGFDGIRIDISSFGENVDFRFTKEIKNKLYNGELQKEIGSVSLPFSVCQPLLDFLFNEYKNSDLHPVNRVYEEDVDYINNKIAVIKEALKTAVCNAPTDIDDYEQCSINIEDNGLVHTLKIGMLAKYGRLLTTSMVGVIEIPMNIIRDNETNNKINNKQKSQKPQKDIYTNLMIPTWEISQYPCLKNFVNHQDSVTSLKELILKIKENSEEMSGMLHYNLLNLSLENENKKSLIKNKI